MSSHRHLIARNWFQETFDALYPVVYAHRTIEAARAETEFSIRETRIGPGDRVLDLCCGAGRHMAHLVQAGSSVVGLDFSTHLLELAREAVDCSSCLVRADMRNIPFQNAFDVVVNYFTSFGYFPSEEENLQVVSGIANALRPGGRFFIDYLNAAWAESNLEEESHRSVDGFDITERRWIDYDKRRINKSTRVSIEGDEINHAGESIQMYTTDEFRALLEKGGLRVDTFYGDYDGDSFAEDRPRMIAVGTKV